MVKLMGHIAIGLLFATPAWALWDGRLALAFIGFVLATVMLPDVDLVLREIIPTIDHHGITHTVLFVFVVAVLGGLLAGRALVPILERWWLASEDHPVSAATIRRFVIGGLFLGGLSHLFADILSAPDVAEPIEPFWPFFPKPVSIDVIYYSSIWWNLGLLLVAVLAHVAIVVSLRVLRAESAG